MILPDHPTPIRLRTHTITPVPFMIYSSKIAHKGTDKFTELLAEETGNYLPRGHELIEIMLSNEI